MLVVKTCLDCSILPDIHVLQLRNMKNFRLVLYFAYFIGVLAVNAFENLSKRNTTAISLSSTYVHYLATFANDGDNITNDHRVCSHTELNKDKAWLQLDFGKPYSINTINIYYRNEDNWKPYRFRQFYIDMSDIPATLSNTSERTRCYTDNTTYPDLPPFIMEVPCKLTARYLIVETTYDAPEDDPNTGAILEICEIEVFGCEVGEYGAGCKSCIGCEVCDITSGKCRT